MIDRIVERFPLTWKQLLFFGALGVAMRGVGDLIVSETAPPASPETGVALVLLELVALMLPALAIILQVGSSYSRNSVVAILGEGADFRSVVHMMVGGSSILLAVSVYVIVRYLELPEPLRWAVDLIMAAMYLFALVPLSIGIFGRKEEINQAEKFYDAMKAGEWLSKFKKYPEDVQETVWDVVDDDVLDQISDEGSRQASLDDDWSSQTTLRSSEDSTE